MQKFKMTCSCGDTFTVDAANREDAIGQIQAMMTPEAIQKHMAERHPGEPVPTTDTVHAMIQQGVAVA